MSCKARRVVRTTELPCQLSATYTSFFFLLLSSPCTLFKTPLVKIYLHSQHQDRVRPELSTTYTLFQTPLPTGCQDPASLPKVPCQRPAPLFKTPLVKIRRLHARVLEGLVHLKEMVHNVHF